MSIIQSETMRQAILTKKGGPIVIKKVKKPKVGPGQVLIRVKVATICKGTDGNTVKGLHVSHDWHMKGMLPHHLRIWDKREPDDLRDFYPTKLIDIEPFPTPMGHEAAGEVVEVGEPVKNELGAFFGGHEEEFTPGDRVTGIGISGGFGDFVVLPMENTFKIPEQMSYEEGSLIEPVYGVYNPVRRVVSAGDTVAVLGQGCLGLIATQIAKVLGATKIIVSEPVKEKRELALKLGADIALDPNKKNIVHEIEKLTNGAGVDKAIECAGVPETIKALPYIMKRGGMIAQIGACCVPVKFDYGYVHFKGLCITSQSFEAIHGNWREIFKKSITLVSSGKVKVKPLISHSFPLTEIQKAFEVILKDEKSIKVAIIP